ncbi:hypothetical protein OIE52_39010 [Streptomyces canus]|uniref:hypothetical protein n=1 Tax=Streptomyces canus TaxID=58343 RepID=UPI0032436379
MNNPPTELTEGLESIRRAMAVVANDRPTPEQIAEWNAADKAMAQRIRAALPGVPLHHAYAVLRALRVTQRLDAAAVPAGLVAVPPTTTDRAGLRDRIAAALYERERQPRDPHWPDVYASDREVFETMADAVLAVLPAGSEDTTPTRAAVLREAADELGRMDYDTDSNDYGYDTYRDAWNGGVMDGADLLRRLADEAQPNPDAGGDLVEDCLRFLRGQGPEPDLSDLAPEQREAIAGQFEIVKALADRDPELPPLGQDPVARRLGLHAPAAETQPEYTESVIYEVVGDWGVDSADSAAGARAAVAKWLRAYPKCGAYAQQRIYRDWPDGSEYYGPWTVLPDHPAAASAGVQTDEETNDRG